MSPAEEILRQGLNLAWVLALPLAAAALTGSFLGAWLARLVGAQDAGLVGLVRAICVVAAAVYVAPYVAAQTLTFGADALRLLASGGS
jgi:uncharacterized membrane protein YfcA